MASEKITDSTRGPYPSLAYLERRFVGFAIEEAAEMRQPLNSFDSVTRGAVETHRNQGLRSRVTHRFRQKSSRICRYGQRSGMPARLALLAIALRNGHSG